jgi:hypothetical protein
LGAVTVKTGPVACWPKTVTVTGPETAPKGTIAVICVCDADATVAGTPPKDTETFATELSKLLPDTVTTVAGGPDAGFTALTTGGNADATNAEASAPLVPSGFTARSVNGPILFGAVVPIRVVELRTVTSISGTPARETSVPELKFAPVTVTLAPPEFSPAAGWMEDSVGGWPVIISPPVSAEVASARWAKIGLTPGAAKASTEVVSRTVLPPLKTGAARLTAGPGI